MLHPLYVVLSDDVEDTSRNEDVALKLEAHSRLDSSLQSSLVKRSQPPVHRFDVLGGRLEGHPLNNSWTAFSSFCATWISPK